MKRVTKGIGFINTTLFLIALVSCGSSSDGDNTSKEGEACSIDAESTCEGGLFCEYPIGSCGETKGKCSAVPQICATIYMPVCGCDGVTYSNACEAKGHRLSLKNDRECQSN